MLFIFLVLSNSKKLSDSASGKKRNFPLFLLFSFFSSFFQFFLLSLFVSDNVPPTFGRKGGRISGAPPPPAGLIIQMNRMQLKKHKNAIIKLNETLKFENAKTICVDRLNTYSLVNTVGRLPYYLSCIKVLMVPL